MTLATYTMTSDTIFDVTLMAGASVQAALSDGSDTTFVRYNDSGDNSYVDAFWPTSISLVAGSVITGVYLSFRAAILTSSVQLSVRNSLNGVSSTYPAITVSSTSVATYTTAVAATDPSGNPWTVANLNAQNFNSFIQSLSSSYQMYLYDVTLNILYNAPAASSAVTFGGASGGATVNNTTRPAVAWTYSDIDGLSQAWYRYKVFTSAQQSIGGFNPDTSPNTYDSGDVPSSQTTASLPVDLANGTWYVYVKVAAAYSSMNYGAYANTSIVLNVTRPAAPTSVVPTTSTVLSRIQTVVTGADASGTVATWLGAGTVWIVVEYSDDGGTTWKTLRGSPVQVTVSTSENATMNDFEFQSGVARTYRARVQTITTAGLIITGPNTTSVTATITITDWWMKVPKNSTLNTQFTDVFTPDSGTIGLAMKTTKHEAAAWFNPLGRTRRVKITDKIHGEYLNLIMTLTSSALKNAFEAIHESQQVIYLQSPTGDSWYLAFDVDRNLEWMINYSPVTYYLTIGAEQVDTP